MAKAGNGHSAAAIFAGSIKDRGESMGDRLGAASAAFTIGGLAASLVRVGLGVAAFGAAVLIIDQSRRGCPGL